MAKTTTSPTKPETRRKARQVFDLPTLDPAQRAFFADDARVQVVCWHRQKGKDFTTAAKAVSDALQTHRPWYIVSLTQRQADETFAKCVWWAKKYKAAVELGRQAAGEQYDETLDQAFQFRARELQLPGGGKVVSLPGRDPDTLAGLTGNVIFTEFGLFPGGGYTHWRVVFPRAPAASTSSRSARRAARTRSSTSWSATRTPTASTSATSTAACVRASSCRISTATRRTSTRSASSTATKPAGSANTSASSPASWTPW